MAALWLIAEALVLIRVEKNVGYEVRAGLTSVYSEKGWVADDIHSEAASRTLDYACVSVSSSQHDGYILMKVY